MFPVKVKIEKDAQISMENELLVFPQVEAQVVIHIEFHACFSSCPTIGCGFEVNSNTYLITNGGSKSGLVQALNVNLSPTRMTVTKKTSYFTLLFNAFPQSATNFDFIEPCAGGWRLANIKRNKTDVYILKIHRYTVELIG